jgi:hypothetical protein
LELLKNWFKRSFSDPQVVILGLFLIIGFAVIIGLGKWLAPVFASLVIAYLLEAIVSRLQKLGMPRMPAVIIVFLLFMTLLLFLLFGLMPIITRQLTQLVQQLPDYIAQGQTLLKQLPQNYPQLVSEEQVSGIISQVGQEIAGIGQKALSWSLSSLGSVLTLVVYLVLLPVLVFFFLKDKELMLNWAGGHLPKGLSNLRHISHPWSAIRCFAGDPGGVFRPDSLYRRRGGYHPDCADRLFPVRLTCTRLPLFSPSCFLADFGVSGEFSSPFHWPPWYRPCCGPGRGPRKTRLQSQNKTSHCKRSLAADSCLSMLPHGCMKSLPAFSGHLA